MSGGLNGVTSVTAVVARDLQALSSRMRAADSAGTRAWAGGLRWHAALLAARVGRQAAALRIIVRAERDGTHKQYFAVVLAALAHQWSEAQDLMRLAILAWWDPMVSVPGHVARVRRLDGDARWQAWQSVELSRRAQAWRSDHRRSFRYVAVSAASAVASAGS